MDDYQIRLLEFLAWRAAPGNKEFDQWRKDFKEAHDAGHQQGAAPLHGDVQSRPETRSGEVPQHEPRQNVGVRQNLGEKLTDAQRRNAKK